MTIEHIAFPVLDPVAVAQWYTLHLGLRVLRTTGAPTYTHFLADAAGSCFEIYNNPKVAVPNYTQLDPLLLHLAFTSDDVRATRDALVAAGCSVYEEPVETPAGDVLCMLRDPWGLPVQLVKRRQPMK